MFIRNVPGTWAPDHAQTLLREHYGGTNGGVLDIRLPRYPNGALRGIAYVQFNDEVRVYVFFFIFPFCVIDFW
jgi:hypothetical protein